jgi:hypothetical protein
MNPDGSIDPVWEALSTMVDQLSAAGMSSDESEDDEMGRTAFIVRKQNWRNKDVTRLLRLVDRDHNKTNAFGNRKAGNPARTRIVRARGSESRREAVPGLPINFYDRTWYAGLTNRDKKELAPLCERKLADIVER